MTSGQLDGMAAKVRILISNIRAYQEHSDNSYWDSHIHYDVNAEVILPSCAEVNSQPWLVDIVASLSDPLESAPLIIGGLRAD